MSKVNKVKIIPRGGVTIMSSSNMLKSAQAAQRQLEKRGIYDVSVQELEVKHFPCGEVKPKIVDNVRGREVFFFYGFTTSNFNNELMTLFLALNALDKADCKRVTLVLPFFPYTRQDRKDEARTPLSAAVIIGLLCQSSSFERIVTMDMHSAQLELAFPTRIKLDHLPGSILMSRWIKKNLKKSLSDIVIVAPDNGSAKRAHKLAELVGPQTPIAIFDKERSAEGIKIGSIIGADVAGKICLLNDDMIDTGGTIVNAALTLKEYGAAEVIISCTHPIFSSKKTITEDGKERIVTAYEKLVEAGVTVVVTDSLQTVPHKWLKVIPVGTLMGDVIFENITPDGSVSKIIEG